MWFADSKPLSCQLLVLAHPQTIFHWLPPKAYHRTVILGGRRIGEGKWDQDGKAWLIRKGGNLPFLIGHSQASKFHRLHLQPHPDFQLAELLGGAGLTGSGVHLKGWEQSQDPFRVESSTQAVPKSQDILRYSIMACVSAPLHSKAQGGSGVGGRNLQLIPAGQGSRSEFQSFRWEQTLPEFQLSSGPQWLCLENGGVRQDIPHPKSSFFGGWLRSF